MKIKEGLRKKEKKMAKFINDFDGKTNFAEWIFKFDTLFIVHDWAAATKAARIVSSMSDAALTFVSVLPVATLQ